MFLTMQLVKKIIKEKERKTLFNQFLFALSTTAAIPMTKYNDFFFFLPIHSCEISQFCSTGIINDLLS